MSIPTINEGSSGVFEFSLYDRDNVLAVPATIHYRIDDVKSSVAIRASTAVTPAVSSGTIDVLPADTTLQDQESDVELRLLTLTLNAGLDTQFHKTFLFEVFNLRFVT